MRLKLITGILALVLYNSIQAKPQFGKEILFNDDWRFILSDEKEGASPNYDDANWQQIDLPHDWSVKAKYSPDRASCTGYLPGGIGWYRKAFTVPMSEKDKKVYIYFEGVYNHSEVFINGKSVGKRPNGYISFMYDLTPDIKFGQENVLAVRVDHSQEQDSRWYSGSGIYRDVFLVYASQVHIDLWGVYFKSVDITKEKAEISVETTINNTSSTGSDVEVLHEIVDPVSGKVVATNSKKMNVGVHLKAILQQKIFIQNPKCWSPERPTLYTLKTIVKQKGNIIDQNEQKIGLRTLTFDADKGFALNGSWTKMKGVCIHHDAGCLGSAVPRDVWKKRLLTLKDLGCNAIRTSHNPQSTDVYDLCDELGLFVMDEAFDEWEFPKRKWVTGWSTGTPEFQGAASFFNEWSDKDISDMVLRDRNHASIMMWSIGNEVDYPNDPYSHPILDHPVPGGYLTDHPNAERLGGIAKRLVADVKEFDQSRPVTAALAGVVMSNETEYPFALDITGYNYTEDRYAEDHAKYPKRVIFGSENGHSMAAWKAVRDNDHIFGQFLWTGIDYLGESTEWPSRGFYSGLLDFGGFIKPRGHFRQALWSTKPVTYIGTYPQPVDNKQLSMDAWPVWNYSDNQIIRVVCYTNAPKSKLLLNGKQVGEVKNLSDSTGIIYWDIPYQKGKLEVESMNNSQQPICRYVIQSSEEPNAITAISYLSTIKKDNGVAQVTVQIVDENGIPVMISDNEVTCTIEGPAKLLGLEASNNTDMGNYSDNIQRVYHGRLLAYIQANGDEGKINVRFSSPWLKEANIIIESIK